MAERSEKQVQATQVQATQVQHIETQEKSLNPAVKSKKVYAKQLQTNDITLKYLTNPYYTNVISARQKNIINKEESASAVNKEDIHFYRKRIVALMKDMLKGIDPPIPNNDIKTNHDEYVRHMINYFKMIDRKDILQDQYSQEEEEEEKEEEGKTDLDDIDITGIQLEKVNELFMMKKTIKVANLDDFVIISNKVDEKEERTIPIKKEIDLKSPNLKTKGIKKKIKK